MGCVARRQAAIGRAPKRAFAALAWAMAVLSLFSCSKGSRERGQIRSVPRAALVLPSSGGAWSAESFRGFYDEAKRRGARIGFRGEVYDFGAAAYLEAGEPMEGGADRSQLALHFAEAGAGLVILVGQEFSAVAASAALERPETRFVVLDAPRAEGAPSNCSFVEFSVEEGAFLAGVLVKALTTGDEGPTPAFLGLKGQGESLAEGFRAGLGFPSSAASPLFARFLAESSPGSGRADEKPAAEALRQGVKAGLSALLFGPGVSRDAASEIAASEGLFLVCADFRPEADLKPAAWVEKKYDAAVAKVLGLYLSGATATPKRLGVKEGCVALKPGPGSADRLAPIMPKVEQAAARLAEAGYGALAAEASPGP